MQEVSGRRRRPHDCYHACCACCAPRVQSRYLKLRRFIPQSPWFLDGGQRKGERVRRGAPRQGGPQWSSLRRRSCPRRPQVPHSWLAAGHSCAPPPASTSVPHLRLVDGLVRLALPDLLHLAGRHHLLGLLLHLRTSQAGRQGSVRVGRAGLSRCCGGQGCRVERRAQSSLESTLLETLAGPCGLRTLAISARRSLALASSASALASASLRRASCCSAVRMGEACGVRTPKGPLWLPGATTAPRASGRPSPSPGAPHLQHAFQLGLGDGHRVVLGAGHQRGRARLAARGPPAQLLGAGRGAAGCGGHARLARCRGPGAAEERLVHVAVGRDGAAHAAAGRPGAAAGAGGGAARRHLGGLGSALCGASPPLCALPPGSRD